MTRASVVGLALAVLLSLVGCKSKQGEVEQGAARAGELAPAPAPLPTDEAGFLAELMPLPTGPRGTPAEAIEISYAVSGPALEGELTILLREGGYKRERWELRTTGGATELRSAGRTIVNPEQIWSAPEGEAGELRPNQLGALARAWAALEPPRRDAVVEAIRGWHALLDERREQNPGDRGAILGVSCLETRIAAQNLCMWEALGVFLRYEGSAFTIEATQIDRAPELPADAFELPPEAAEAERVELEPVDFSAALDEAANNNFSSLFLLISRTQALPKVARPSEPPPTKDEDAKTETAKTAETG